MPRRSPDWPARPGAIRAHLGPLDRAGIAAALADAYRASPDRVVDAVLARTGGDPARLRNSWPMRRPPPVPKATRQRPPTSPHANATCSAGSPRACPTSRSRRASASPCAPSPYTCRTCSARPTPDRAPTRHYGRSGGGSGAPPATNQSHGWRGRVPTTKITGKMGGTTSAEQKTETSLRALTVRPGIKDSLALSDLPEPPESDGPVLVEAIAVGLCGTDTEIVNAEYGEAPPGSEVLVLGHENLGRVADAGGSGLVGGDLVVGFVRRPDPVPCPACAVGEWDMCRNGQYIEHGIKGLHGFARERWRAPADAAGDDRSGAGRRRRAAGADHDRGEGLGADRADRRPRLLRPEGRRDHRRRADRAAGRDARRTAWARGARLRHRHRRSETGAGRPTSARTYHSTSLPDERRAAGHRHRVHRRAVGDRRRARRTTRPTASSA